MKRKAIFLISTPEWGKSILPRVYPEDLRRRITAAYDLHPEVIHKDDLARPEVADITRSVEVIFSTWGMPAVPGGEIDRLFPRLGAVFYAAGTVQSFARPFLHRSIKVVSSWAANAVPVSEFTLAQILLATKNTQRLTRHLHNAGPEAWIRDDGPGNYTTTVALISLGMIGARVARLLKPFDLNVIAYEPFPKPGMTEELGVTLATLEECFATADVVSLHAPNLPSTRQMIRREHFAAMPRNGTFINTARGGPVDQEAMLDVLAARPDLTAIIDVTDPTEPPPAGSRYYSLPNVYLTPHIAGAGGREVARLGLYAVEEAERFARGEPLRYGVTEPMLATMA